MGFVECMSKMLFLTTKQTRFVSHQPLTRFACERPLFVTSKHYIHLATYAAKAVKSGCVMIWKVIMTVEISTEVSTDDEVRPSLFQASVKSLGIHRLTL